MGIKNKAVSKRATTKTVHLHLDKETANTIQAIAQLDSRSETSVALILLQWAALKANEDAQRIGGNVKSFRQMIDEVSPKCKAGCIAGWAIQLKWKGENKGETNER